MARLKAESFDELYDFVGTRYHRPIGNNTVAVRDGADAFDITLHGKHIVRMERLWYGGSVYPLRQMGFTEHGWPTVTTRERINHFLPAGLRLIQRDWRQILTAPDGQEADIAPCDWYVVHGGTPRTGTTVVNQATGEVLIKVLAAAE